MFACLIAAIATLAAGVVAQQTLTPEWIAGEGSQYADTPETAWRSDGSLWIYDDRSSDRSPSFELLDPATGARRAIVESAKALTTLNAALPSGEALPKLPWPTLDDSGRVRRVRGTVRRTRPIVSPPWREELASSRRAWGSGRRPVPARRPVR